MDTQIDITQLDPLTVDILAAMLGHDLAIPCQAVAEIDELVRAAVAEAADIDYYFEFATAHTGQLSDKTKD